MIAGTYFCTATQNELVWQGAAPEGLLVQNSRCGSETLSCSTNDAQNFQNLLDSKKCDSIATDDGVSFVCTNKSKQLTKHIEDLCKQAITGATQK